MRGVLKVVTFIIIGLAVIGLVSQLTTNTIGFLVSLLITALIAVIIFAIVRKIMLGRQNQSDEMKKYNQAVKASKKRYQKNQQTKFEKMIKAHPTPNQPVRKKSSRRRATHLRVIEGNKSKKKPS